ncbi:MAG: hypothetical protein OHK0021_11420 [Bryobacter sp.]
MPELNPESSPAPETRAVIEPHVSRRRRAPLLVAVGSSAGGLEALRSLLHRLPVHCGYSYVIAQHLSPTHLSMLTALLSRETTLPVVQIEDDTDVSPSTIYVTPPNADVVFEQGSFRLQAPQERGPKPSVDTLLLSIARNLPERSVAVILSGSGSDGALGARQLKNSGGYLIVQQPSTAKYPPMPQSAIATGLADAVLPPEQIGPYLETLKEQFAAMPYRRVVRRPSDIDKVLECLLRQTGIDFGGYKPNTIYRRIQQRISATRSANMTEYLNHLQENPEEIRNLTQHCLISVTEFFRDPEAWGELEKHLRERIDPAAPEPIRAWVAGCATGEEAYTLAILLSRHAPMRRIQIFATDLDDHAIHFARRAIYPAAAVKTLDSGIRDRHFVESVQGYGLAKGVRDRVVFARHDLANDPLFLNLDLITCRNLLIYFKAPLQEDIFLKFHHALKPGGLLFLGRSENILGDGFDTVSRKHRVFANRPLGENERQLPLPREWQAIDRVGDYSSPPPPVPPEVSLDSTLLQFFNPRALLVDASFKILEMRGNLNNLLTLPTGRANFSLLNLLPKPVAAYLRAQAQRQSQDPVPKALPPRVYKINGQSYAISLIVLSGSQQHPHFAVVFEDHKPEHGGAWSENGPGGPTQGPYEDLERELQATRECLEATVEELETSNEELQALNEEMQASNEELQASNEELHSSNEELQSTNEELLTVNEEIEHKSLELALLIEDLETIQNSLDGPLLVADARGYLRHVNEEARRLFGLTANHLSGPFVLPNDPPLATNLASKILKVIETGEAVEHRAKSHNRTFRISLRPYVARQKGNRGAVAVFQDISQLQAVNESLRRSEQRLRLSSARYKSTIDALPANIAVLNDKGIIQSVNSGWRKFAQDNGARMSRFGVGANYLRICQDTDDVHAQAIAAGLEGVLKGELPQFGHEYPCHSPSQRRWFRCLVTPYWQNSSHGAASHGVVVMHFETSEQRLREERDQHRLLALDVSPYPCFTADPNGLLDWANPAFCELFEMDRDELRGQHPASLEIPGNQFGFQEMFAQVRASGESVQGEVRLQSKAGLQLFAAVRVYAAPGDEAGLCRYVVCCEDITNQKLAEARTLHTLEHDELTGLLNRKSTIQRLGRAIERQRAANGKIVLFFLDLDRFKDTNDTLGHFTGDQILIEAANRLRATAPSYATLGRFGGDEFVVFLENPGAEDDITELAQSFLVAFSRPLLHEGRPLQISASIGVAQYPQDAEGAEDLLRRADLAMYRAKAEGRRGFRRFDQQIQKDIEDRIWIERDLTRSLSTQDFWVAYQPQIDLATRRVVGVEALLRWNHPEANSVPISRVIHIAEESGLILPIGQWVVREAIRDLARWLALDPQLCLSVNLSAVQFNQQDIFGQIMEHLHFFKLPSERLKVEITESVLLHRSSRVREALHALHGAGVGLHLDDFGTGYSSLAYLQQFPIEAVKIDASFLRGVGRERQDEAIVDAIVKLARSLGIGAVAEGVENQQQVDFLQRSGCPTGQGFHWAKPLNASDFTNYLIQQNGAAPLSFAHGQGLH